MPNYPHILSRTIKLQMQHAVPHYKIGNVLQNIAKKLGKCQVYVK